MKYEYLIQEDCNTIDLNKIGDAGWELVSVTYSSGLNNSRKFYFKRIKKV